MTQPANASTTIIHVTQEVRVGDLPIRVVVGADGTRGVELDLRAPNVRSVTFTPEEAREHAVRLIQAANEADEIDARRA